MKTIARQGGKGDAGFTLLEIMIVTLVFALLSAALWQGSGTGVRGWVLQQRTYERMAEFQGMEDALRRVISRADSSDSGQPPALGGTDDRLHLVSWFPDHGGYGHEMEIGLGVDADHRLALHWRPYRRAQCATDSQSTHEEILARGIRAMTLSYYGGSEGHHEWRRDWTSAELPTLIRMHFETMTPGMRWPDVIIRPLVSGAGSS